MENVLIVSTLDEMRDLIRILLDNNKTVTSVALTINGNYEISWEEPEEMDE